MAETSEDNNSIERTWHLRTGSKTKKQTKSVRNTREQIRREGEEEWERARERVRERQRAFTDRRYVHAHSRDAVHWRSCIHGDTGEDC